jgi:outer membrane protein assembly factor BamE
MRKLLISITYFATMFLAGCAMDPVTNLFTNIVYKIDVKQGNVITKEMIDQLKPGMNKRQIRYLLGTPILIDVFHQERWDYIYTDKPGGYPRLQKRISLFFKEDQLAGLQGDFKPEAVAQVGLRKKSTTVLVPKRAPEKSLFQKFLALIGLGEDEEAAQADADTAETKEEK